MTIIPTAENAQMKNVTSTAISSLVMGRSGDWWDTCLIISGSLAAIAAIAIVVSTAGSVLAHKREAVAASVQFEAYKNQASVDVANAAKAASEADLKAAQANERAAKTEESNLKLQAQIAPRRLKDGPVPGELVMAMRGRHIEVMSYAGDVEGTILASQIIDLATQLGAAISDGRLTQSPLGAIGLGISVTGADTVLQNALVAFFTSQGLAATTNPFPTPAMRISAAGGVGRDLIISVGAKPPN